MRHGSASHPLRGASVSATVWGKFFWSDWRADPCLRACSYAARGLWIDLLCIAAESDPKGFVLIAGRACDARAIARVTGGQVEEVETLLVELEEHGVFSRNESGVIYSRRMVADGERSKTGSVYGKRGGVRPELPFDQPGGVGGRGGGPPPTQSPESRNQIPEGRGRARARNSLPGDWAPNAENVAYARQNGFADGTIKQMGESFRDHHVHKGTMGLDWNGAWRTWCRNEIKFSRNRAPARAAGGAAGLVLQMMRRNDEEN